MDQKKEGMIVNTTDTDIEYIVYPKEDRLLDCSISQINYTYSDQGDFKEKHLYPLHKKYRDSKFEIIKPGQMKPLSHQLDKYSISIRAVRNDRVLYLIDHQTIKSVLQMRLKISCDFAVVQLPNYQYDALLKGTQLLKSYQLSEDEESQSDNFKGMIYNSSSVDVEFLLHAKGQTLPFDPYELIDQDLSRDIAQKQSKDKSAPKPSSRYFLRLVPGEVSRFGLEKPKGKYTLIIRNLSEIQVIMVQNLNVESDSDLRRKVDIDRHSFETLSDYEYECLVDSGVLPQKGEETTIVKKNLRINSPSRKKFQKIKGMNQTDKALFERTSQQLYEFDCGRRVMHIDMLQCQLNEVIPELQGQPKVQLRGEMKLLKIERSLIDEDNYQLRILLGKWKGNKFESWRHGKRINSPSREKFQELQGMNQTDKALFERTSQQLYEFDCGRRVMHIDMLQCQLNEVIPELQGQPKVQLRGEMKLLKIERSLIDEDNYQLRILLGKWKGNKFESSRHEKSIFQA